MRLNLGSGDDMRGGEWLNVDIAPPAADPSLEHSPQFEIADLARPWPWDDSGVDEIYAADIFEHIGDCDHVRSSCHWCSHLTDQYPYHRHLSGRIHVMNESWRVLKPGGILRMECPDAAKGAGHFQDPTHTTPWTPNGLQYFADGSPAWKRFAAAYGITARFRILSVTERKYEELAGPLKRGLGDMNYVRCEVYKFAAVLEAVK